MKSKEAGFRPFYRNFCALPLTEELKPQIDGLPMAEHANSVLVYGYIDPDLGFRLQIVAAAFMEEDGESFRFAESDEKLCEGRLLTWDDVENLEFAYFDDGDGSIMTSYGSIVDALQEYFQNDDLELSREFDFLDPFRNPHHPDQVMVTLFREGYKIEKVPVHIDEMGDEFFMGVLLEEPEQNYEYHKGEQIAFFYYEDEKGEHDLLANLTPSAELKEEDLEDGTKLESAIRQFFDDQSEENFLEILETLRDSTVWIPCDAIFDEDEMGGVVPPMAMGDDDVRIVPDILQSDDDLLFLPVFSNPRAMGDYGDDFSKVANHFLEVIEFAEVLGDDLEGIVVNPFTEEFIMDKETWRIIPELKTRLVK